MNQLYKLLRGGSWYFLPRDCRSAFRFSFLPGYRYGSIGFRVCCAKRWPTLYLRLLAFLRSVLYH